MGSNAHTQMPLMMLQELQNPKKLNWVLLGSNVHIQRPLMMLQELQNPKRINWVLLGSNLNTNLQSFYNFPLVVNLAGN